MKYILNILSFIILFELIGCSKLDSKKIPSNDAIQEAVFRAQLLHYYDSTDISFFCILAKIEYDSVSKSYTYANPSDSIIFRIKHNYPKVLKYSESSYYDSNSTYGGDILFVESWYDSTKSGIVINGGDYFARNCITYYKYYLHNRMKEWIVDSTENNGYNFL